MPEQPIFQTSVVIIGAGLSGLIAARELKKNHISFKILEAGNTAGGRVQTRAIGNEAIFESGAQWLHGGAKNPLRSLIEEYDIAYEDDQPSQQSIVTYYNGKRYDASFRDKLLSPFTGKHIINTLGAVIQLRDVPLAKISKGEQSKIMEQYQPIWIGTDKPDQSSAIEVLHDPYGPGGLQPHHGLTTLINKLVEEVGKENIVYNAPVTQITNTRYGAKAETKDGVVFAGKKILFTGSVGVLKSNNITFEPPHQTELKDYLAGITMGKMAKIVLPMNPEFFAERPHLKNMHIDLLDGIPTLCHVNSNGQPIITLLIGGDAAEKIESMPPEALSQFIKDKLSIAEELKGYESHIQGSPFATDWAQNPHTLGSYSARNTHARRCNSIQEGNILYAGEAFDTHSPGTLCGAYRSGLNAAEIIIDERYQQLHTSSVSPSP